MLKLITDDELLIEEMSAYLTELDDAEPCVNCLEVKEAIRKKDIARFCQITNYATEEAAQEIKRCKRCLWFWVDEVDIIENEAE